VRSVGEECVSDAELRNLMIKKPNFVLYDGFEPSGRMHIAQGVFKAMNVNKCTAAGGTFIFWVADWFALMNDKMGGDLERIKTVGQYLIQVWTAAGMDMERVKFLWSSEEITKHAPRYWTQAMDIARRFTVTRIKKCCQIMGRLEDTLTAAQILYPIMQCTDIFFLKADGECCQREGPTLTLTPGARAPSASPTRRVGTAGEEPTPRRSPQPCTGTEGMPQLPDGRTLAHTVQL
jgi:tyrosyl-tRNA synthetase